MQTKRKLPSTTHIRTFEIVQYVTGFLHGTLNDWPANIQDQVYAALERLAQRVKLPLAIVFSCCDIDHGDVAGQDKYYLHIVASEIVAADSRFYKSAQDEIKRIVDEMMKGTVH